MGIVTISRELGSLGTEIADCLSESLQLTLIEKDTIEKKLVAFGFREEYLEMVDEKKPSFWIHFSAEKDKYVHYLKLLVYELAADDSCIVLGRGGHYLFQDVPEVLKIRFTAPYNDRIARIQERYGGDESEAALLLKHSDKDRTGYHRFFFETSWNDPMYYDLFFNTHALSIPQICRIVKDAVAMLDEPAPSARRKKSLEELVISQRVVVAILYEHDIPVNFLSAGCENGVVTLDGYVSVMHYTSRCAEIAKSVEGVRSVVNNIVFSNTYPTLYARF